MVKGRVIAFCLALALAVGCSGGETFRLVGVVERKNLELAAPVSEIIVGIPFQVGQRVEKGQVVVQLDVEVAEAEFNAYQASVNAAQATLEEAENEYQRVEKLRQSRVLSASELDRARERRDRARAEHAQSVARLKQARKRMSDCSIRANSSGVIDQLPFDVGERAPAGGVVAVVLADERPWVRVWLPARASARARPGLEAEVRAEGIDRLMKGRIEDVAREPEFTPHYALTERERAYLVFETRVVLEDAPADLRPGIPADVKLVIPALAEPASEGEAQ